jgi:hypothetical protein
MKPRLMAKTAQKYRVLIPIINPDTRARQWSVATHPLDGCDPFPLHNE